MSCPLSFSSAHSLRRLSDVHNCRRIGSPRVTGSSSDLRSERRVGSSVIFDLRPPPCRRILSFLTEARSSRSASPRYIVRRASPLVSATPLTPPCPIIRASDAAQRRRLRSSSKGAVAFQRFRRVLMSEAIITRRFYRRRFHSGVEKNPRTDGPNGDMARNHKAGGQGEPHAARMGELLPSRHRQQGVSGTRQLHSDAVARSIFVERTSSLGTPCGIRICR